MEQIALFLEKYKRFGFKNQIVKETLIEIIKQKFGVKIDRGDIDVKEGNVIIKVTGALKSEIFLNKYSIHKELNELLEKNNQAHTIR